MGHKMPVLKGCYSESEQKNRFCVKFPDIERRGGVLAAGIREVAFRRMGYSGDEKFAEVMVTSDDFNSPVIVTFKQERDGNLSLVSVSGIDEEHSVDWFDNNLHSAYPDLTQQLFPPPSGAAMLRKFAAEVLSFGDTEEMLKDKFYYGE
jgi:hypothetical protein